MKRFSLFVVIMFSLFLIWCGNQSIEQESETNTKIESDFNVSDCIKWCDLIRDKDWFKEEMFLDCKSLCEGWKAMEELNPSACEKLDSIIKDSCYSNIAYETNNSELCGNIEDLMMKHTCYAIIAEEIKDVSLCNKIDDKIFKNICIENVKNIK